MDKDKKTVSTGTVILAMTIVIVVGISMILFLLSAQFSSLSNMINAKSTQTVLPNSQCSTNPTVQNCGTPAGMDCAVTNSSLLVCADYWLLNNGTTVAVESIQSVQNVITSTK